MIRRLRWGLALAMAAVALSTSVAAQDGVAKPGSAKLVGAWEGQYLSDGPSGSMTLTVSDKPAWGVAVALTGDVPPAGEATAVAADGNVLSWKQVIGEYDVSFKATLSEDGAQITGTLEATQGGAYVGGGSFTLSRKANK